jgi:hypothetical protein
MRTDGTKLSLTWFILIVIVIAGTRVLWIQHKAGSVDPRRRQYTKQQWMQMIKQAEPQPPVR